MSIIEVTDLTRRFGDFTAVDALNLAVEPGEIFGFLGPNGAGKSTTINMLCTLLRPTSGSATIDGHDLVHDQHLVRCSIGLVFQEPTLDEKLTAWQNMRLHAMLYSIPAPEFESRARELLEMVDLADKAKNDVKTFSGGMKRRLEIAIGLLHSPRLLFLDEPTVGLDPQTRLRIWDYVKDVRDAEGLTVFLTTHYMDEAEVCDRIAIMDAGRVVACDTPDGHKTAVGQDRIRLTTSDDDSAAEQLVNMGAKIVPPVHEDDGLTVEIAHGDRFIPTAIRALDEKLGAGCVSAVTLKRPTLDDVFVRLTGRAIREEGADESKAYRAAARGGGRL